MTGFAAALIVQQHAAVMTFASGLAAFSMQQPCLPGVLVASIGFATTAAFIGHPAGIPVFAVRQAATRSVGRMNPVNIMMAVKSSGSDRRDIVVLLVRYHAGG